NVMLTRCQKGMIIVSSRSFLQCAGKDTLVGELSRVWERHSGRDGTWIDWRKVADKSATLPGKRGQGSSGSIPQQVPPSSKPPSSTVSRGAPSRSVLAKNK
ncbi:hypothetical protein BU17DRAFT_50003, partial [Hysterangium stoloniferum]